MRGEADRRIIFVNRYYAPDESATSQLLTDIVTALAACGDDVHVVTSRQLYDQPGANLGASEVLAGARVHRVWTTRFGRARLGLRCLDYVSFYLAAFCTLLALCRRGDVVVVKTDPPLMSVPAGIACRMRRAVLINWLQDLFPEISARLGLLDERGLVFKALRTLRDRTLRQAEANVVLGSRMAATLAARGIDDARFRIIHNWAHHDEISPLPADQNSLRTELGLQGRFVVGYSGNLGRVHDFETILGAASALSDDPQFCFVFIGGGARSGPARDAVLKRGLQNVRFLPYQPRKGLNLSLALPDLHLVSLLPTMEGLVVPSKVYGILAAGRPVAFIGSPDGEVAAMLRALRCGMSFAIGDSDGLACYLRRLASRPALTEMLGRNSRRGFVGRYDFANAFSEWTGLLASAGQSGLEVPGRNDAVQSIRQAVSARRDARVR